MENKVTVEIFGEKYALKGDLKAEKVLKLAAIVDKKMRTVAKGNSNLSPVKVAVLVALNIADEYAKSGNCSIPLKCVITLNA